MSEKHDKYGQYAMKWDEATPGCLLLGENSGSVLIAPISADLWLAMCLCGCGVTEEVNLRDEVAGGSLIVKPGRQHDGKKIIVGIDLFA